MVHPRTWAAGIDYAPGCGGAACFGLSSREAAIARLLDVLMGEAGGNDLATLRSRPAKRQASTEVSRDLQFYPTPPEVADRVLADVYIADGAKVLEPSCGDGRLLEALRRKGRFDLFGIEVDPRRAAEARAKGFAVLSANFLETVPVAAYDHVVMNPPFYGQHYTKHVEHALKYLRPRGILTAILPVTARYDHGLLEGSWSDLPVGAFGASGTNINSNINITVLTVRA